MNRFEKIVFQPVTVRITCYHGSHSRGINAVPNNAWSQQTPSPETRELAIFFHGSSRRRAARAHYWWNLQIQLGAPWVMQSVPRSRVVATIYS
jgi:hypothetical protein